MLLERKGEPSITISNKNTKEYSGRGRKSVHDIVLCGYISNIVFGISNTYLTSRGKCLPHNQGSDLLEKPINRTGIVYGRSSSID